MFDNSNSKRTRDMYEHTFSRWGLWSIRSISQWGGLSQSLDVERICWQPWLQNCRDPATQKQEETVVVLQKTNELLPNCQDLLVKWWTPNRFSGRNAILVFVRSSPFSPDAISHDLSHRAVASQHFHWKGVGKVGWCRCQEKSNLPNKN